MPRAAGSRAAVPRAAAPRAAAARPALNGHGYPGNHHGSPWASRERQRDRQVKREAVIRAAAHAFNRKGYHNTSLDDIAAALEVTKPTVYYYVNNKEQLLFECFVAGVERIRTALREVRNSAAPARQRLNAVLRDYAQAVASEFGWCMVRVEDQDLSPDMSSHVKAMKSEIDQGIRRLIREGIQDGSIHPCDPKMAAFALAGSLNWIAHWYREDQSMNAAEVAAAFITVFDNGLQPRSAADNSDRARRRPARR
ncbi:MAG: TetR family transcriptional regulator [Sinobacteraceae bacterium]|nr:TetR family transcriptional regulator [Nevskiaceae bacterium]